jgi:hypothetical protein
MWPFGVALSSPALSCRPVPQPNTLPLVMLTPVGHRLYGATADTLDHIVIPTQWLYYTKAAAHIEIKCHSPKVGHAIPLVIDELNG